MFFIDQFLALGYVGWNLFLAFFFIGGFFFASVGLYRRSRLWQALYVAALIALFVATVIWLEPRVAAVQDANRDWRERQAEDLRGNGGD